MQTDTLLSRAISRSAVARLHKAYHDEPDPLHATQAEVVRYVTALQQADRALAHAQEAAAATANTSPSDAEAALLQRRRKSVDTAIARQGWLAARRAGNERGASFATLDAIFNMGTAPEAPMDGNYRGELLTPTLFGPIDTVGRFLARLWLPWKGKRFDSAASSGYNYLTRGGHVAGRLVWPLYNKWGRVGRGLYRYFNFKTSTGPGVNDPGTTALKLDYNLPENPGFLVRLVLDELVQVSGGYYLGKAYLRSRGGKYRLAAYFTLHDEEIA